MPVRSARLPRFAAFVVLLSILWGCLEDTPPVGTIEINRDLPILSNGRLRLGITLNPGTTTGRDLLSGNLLINGSFDLAPRLPVSLHAADTTVTTPNGYRQFYPLPEIVYGWQRSDERKAEVIREKLREEEGGSYFLRTSGLRGDTVRLLYNLRTFAGKAGDSFSIKGRLRGAFSKVTAAFVADSLGGKKLSDDRTFITSETWRNVEGTIMLRSKADSAFLQLTFEAYDSVLLPEDTVPQRARTRSANAFADIDDLFLSREGTGSLDTLIMELEPYYIRYPDGLTSGGFYPGTFPLHDTIPNERIPIWTSTGYEHTGHFTLEDYLALSREAGAQPILIENAGITNDGAGRRYEDIALVPDRVKYLKRVLERADTDSLLLQIGYQMPLNDYPRRFADMVSLFEKDTVTPFLITGGLLAPTGSRTFSDYVADYVLPPLSSPDFIRHIPEELRRTFTQPQPIMLGEVHFIDRTDSGERYLPAFLLRAAFLIEAERYAEALKGVSLYPFLSEKPEESPLVLVRDNSFLPTPLFYFSQAFAISSGPEIRSLDYDRLREMGLYCSLTSDTEERNFYLKAANTTRHPLTYRIKVSGIGKEPLKHFEAVRFSPGNLPPDKIPAIEIPYTRKEESRKLSLDQETIITIGAYEALILHLY